MNMGITGFAIRNGVKVEAFSIGFGPELFGWYDKKGTRWKVSLLPLGGYVKMFGDMNPASAGQRDDLNEEERQHAFHHKGLMARASIVFAGPLANFLFAIVVFTVLFAAVGQQRALPVVGRGGCRQPGGGCRIAAPGPDQCYQMDSRLRGSASFRR